MRKKLLHITFVLLLLICTTIGGIGIRTASRSTLPILSMKPRISTAAPGETFKVNITVAGINENVSLYGWEAKISFNPDIVNVTSVVRGPFLRNAASKYTYTTIFTKDIDNSMGVVEVGESVYPKMPPYPKYPPVGATGNGTLATITFRVKAEGAMLLHFEEDRHFLYTVLYDNLLKIDHEAIDGVFDNREPPFLPPVALFDAKPLFAKVNATITFNASASYDPDAWLVSYEWNFGDNTTEIYKGENLTAVATHAYDQSGTYTVKLTVTDYDNLTDTATDYIAVGHDVAVTAVTALPTMVTAGESIAINVTVANKGDVTETFDVTVYYDSIPIDTQTVVSLEVGTNTTIEFTWKTTDVDKGNYTIGAGAILAEDYDPADNWKEAEKSITILVHDVAVTSLEALAEVVLGEIVSINVTVANEGSFDETVTVMSSYNDTPIDTTVIDTLPPGESETVELSWNTTGLSPGTYTINATATIALDVDPNDNFKTKQIKLVAPVHDIAIINVVPSTKEVFVGDSVDINVTVKNEGNVWESFTINVYAGLDLVRTETATLAAGATETYTFTWTTTAVGNFTIKAVASTVEGETDTDDNTWTTTLWRIQVIPEFPTPLPMIIVLLILAVSTIILKRRTGNNR